MLDKLYYQRNKDFPEQDKLGECLTNSIDELRQWTDIHSSKLMRPYVVYSLLLAISHLRNAVDDLSPIFPSPELEEFDAAKVAANLSLLSEALESPDEPGEFEEFVKACTSGTNVRAQRETRFLWLCRALTADFQ